MLVLKGRLKAGDYFVCGPQFGKVRGLLNDQGQKVEEVYPGLPVEVQGFSGVPEAGDEFLVLEDERKAKQIAMMRQQKQREATLARISRVTLEKLYQQEGRRRQGTEDGAQGRCARLHRSPGQGPVRTGEQGDQGLS